MIDASPLVSVVTPFYNTADYLAECIESVLAQSHRHFEYILLNNCSDDGSREIAERYASTDSRYLLHSNSRFLTQTQNYNAALELISPESRYTKIVQADDSIFPRCLEEMVAVAETDPFVGIVSSSILRGRKIEIEGFPFLGNVVCGREICRDQLLNGRRFFASATSVMYRSEIVRARKPFFEEGRYFEDTENCFSILETWNFGFVRQVLSFLRNDNESIMSRVRALDPDWWKLERLIILRQFGPQFLNGEDFDRRWSEVERQYLDHLAPYYLFIRNRAFWDFHIHNLQSVGYELSRFKMRLLAVRYMFTLLARPRECVSRFAGLFSAVKRRIELACRREPAPANPRSYAENGH